jgi:hypothetical protein
VLFFEGGHGLLEIGLRLGGGIEGGGFFRGEIVVLLGVELELLAMFGGEGVDAGLMGCLGVLEFFLVLAGEGFEVALMLGASLIEEDGEAVALAFGSGALGGELVELAAMIGLDGGQLRVVRLSQGVDLL